MSPRTTHPLVDAYLRDLELLLHGIEPGERAEVLAGVREHLDGSLAPGADDASVRAVLAELGPPQAIADEAYAGRPAPSPTHDTPSRWQPVTACAINALGLLLVAFSTVWAMGPWEVIASGLLFALPWCAAFALSMLARTWTPRQRLASALLYPATLLGMGALMAVMLALVGPAFFNLIPTVALFVLAAVVLVRLTKAALR
ncbi:DUF1700 domain-containing protein [Pedococcus bigeumensis]|uniref:DUF1700 domain-containing protein n=1 Tax=Pedococcus bigeumensis TaxID=433644 RepID=A0A502D4R1_9MICO|nr:DUF1700 domain-containing protein [Pedococcus bigeumensis]TPG19086.1 DUF1700 domain-containing protein [Pedococcus bigeumensis]